MGSPMPLRGSHVTIKVVIRNLYSDDSSVRAPLLRGIGYIRVFDPITDEYSGDMTTGW